MMTLLIIAPMVWASEDEDIDMTASPTAATAHGTHVIDILTEDAAATEIILYFGITGETEREEIARQIAASNASHINLLTPYFVNTIKELAIGMTASQIAGAIKAVSELAPDNTTIQQQYDAYTLLVQELTIGISPENKIWLLEPMVYIPLANYTAFKNGLGQLLSPEMTEVQKTTTMSYAASIASSDSIQVVTGYFNELATNLAGILDLADRVEEIVGFSNSIE